MEFLKSIEVQAQDIESFTNFVVDVQSRDSGSIKFNENKIVEESLLGPHPPLFTIAFM